MKLSIITIWGIASRQVGIFLPYLSLIQPKTMVPTMPPMHNIEPIQEVSDLVIGPVGKGDSADSRMGMLGEVHPQEEPYTMVEMFTEIIHTLSPC